MHVKEIALNTLSGQEAEPCEIAVLHHTKETGFFLCLSMHSSVHQIISENYSISDPCGVVRFKGGHTFILIAHALAKKQLPCNKEQGSEAGLLAGL